MSDVKRLIREMHRRSLWQVLGIYVVASWVALQVVDVLAQNFGLPDWFPAFALGLLILGLPIVLATAFVQEGLGPGDADSTGPTSGSRDAAERPDTGARAQSGRGSARTGTTRRLLTWRNALLGGGTAFALWGVVAAGWVLLGGRGASIGGGPASTADSIPSIAVLPLDNLSPDEDDRYFADGIHDEILSQLAQIESMRVTSRQSVLEYRDSERPTREIAAALGVRYLVEGSVRQAEGRVRIIAQLIDGIDDRHLWSDTYEGDLREVFAFQADVARRIARSLDARLSPEVEQRIAAAPTTDPEAYSLYLRAKVAYPRDEAEEHLQAALELDPGFAAAHALLALTYQDRYWWRERDERLLERARESAAHALALAPQLPDAHLALGMAHYRGLELELAEPAFRRALELRPNDTYTWTALGHLLRRQGRFEEAVDAYERATAIDPRSAPYVDLTGTYIMLRRTEDARRAVHLWRAAVRDPRRLVPATYDMRVALYLEGDTAAANAIWATMTLDSLPLRYRLYWIQNRRVRRDPPGLLRAVEAYPDVWAYPAYLIVRAEYEADAHAWSGDEARARASLESARAHVEEGLAEAPDDFRYLGAHARILAALGETEAAIAEAERAVELTPLSSDAMHGTFALLDLAAVHARVGDPARAIDLLEQLLSIPSYITTHALRLDPTWDPLRDDPRFRRLAGEDG